MPIKSPSKASASEKPGSSADELRGLSWGVWVVATPIGNLDDLSIRAKRALESADWIACEDTRRTAALLNALGIDAEGRLRRFDRHTRPETVKRWVDEIQQATNGIAVVSDAGTPGVSDPGALLVQHAVAHGIPIHPVPGPSAVAAVSSALGWPEVQSICFRGFLPRKASDVIDCVRRSIESGELLGEPLGFIWFESPERVVDSLRSFERALENFPDIQMLACKELTKLHEKWFRGTPGEVRQQVEDETATEGNRGEWCIALKAPFHSKKASAADITRAETDSLWKTAMECLLEAGVKQSKASRIVSQRFGISREGAYDFAIAWKKNSRRD